MKREAEEREKALRLKNKNTIIRETSLSQLAKELAKNVDDLYQRNYYAQAHTRVMLYNEISGMYISKQEQLCDECLEYFHRSGTLDVESNEEFLTKSAELGRKWAMSKGAYGRTE